MGSTVVISGPSGVGKGAIVLQVLELLPWLQLNQSATTRARQPGDTKYRFCTEAEFEELWQSGQLLERAFYEGAQAWYGSLMPKPSADVLLEVEVQGAELIKQKIPGAHLVFVEPPEPYLETLEARILARARRTGRKADPVEVAARIHEAIRVEIPQGRRQSDLVVVNHQGRKGLIRASQEIAHHICLWAGHN